MNHLEALDVLGLDPEADWAEVRSAYRGLIRTYHPDRAGDGATDLAAQITEAYTVLETTWDDPPEPTPAAAAGQRQDPSRNGQAAQPAGPPPSSWTGGAVEVVDGDSIALDADAETAFFVMLDAAHDIGEVSFADPSIGMLEAVFELPGTPACSLVISLQGRQDHIDVFCTVEALDGSPAPSLHGVVEVLADLVRQRIGVALDRPVDAPAEWLVDRNGEPGRPADGGQRPTGTM